MNETTLNEGTYVSELPLGAGSGSLLTYTLWQGERVTRRLTVWQRHDGRWRILYHQGTIVAEAP